MPDAAKLISQIQEHFAVRGWRPLLPVKIAGLQSLPPDELQQLAEQVTAARDRLEAINDVLIAIKPKE